MMKERKNFEEYKMKLIWLDTDIICTSDGTRSPGTTDPFPEEDDDESFDDEGYI